MTTFDLSPLFRSTVGFDRVSRLLESAARFDDQAPSYPPYNIEALGEDEYRIVMAVAGFSDDDLNITVENSTLTVSGKLNQPDGEDEEVRYLHRGIAGRAFERRFQLADHIKVKGAKLENGLLQIDLQREIPDELKPRTIEIASGDSGAKRISGRKAA